MASRPNNPLVRAAWVAGAAALLALVFSTGAAAAAAVRFAAPGGTGPSGGPNACPQANPCTLFGAAAEGQGAQPGDEVIVEPGQYSDAAGDLGPGSTVFLGFGIVVHGIANEPRPLITLDRGAPFGGLFVNGGDRVAHIEIQDHADQAGLTIAGGDVDDAIVRATVPFLESIACNQLKGTIRDSACLSSGRRGTALGTAVTIGGSGTTEVAVRNVTAVSTGDESLGVSYRVGGGGGPAGPTFDVDARSVIADGTETDVVAKGVGGAKAHVTLAGSDYANVLASTDGSLGADATVTSVGTNGNLQSPAELAVDGFHELPSSPTVGAGVIDGQSGALDIDGQLRTIGGVPDIGADELGEPTLTALTCAPGTISLGGPPSTCTATVKNVLPGGIPPREVVSMFPSPSGTDAGTFSDGGLCVIAEISSAASCKLDYTPGNVGSGQHVLIASYLGDLTHDSSAGRATVRVTQAAEEKEKEKEKEKERELAPETKLTRSPRKRTAVRNARFAFSTDSPGAGFECKLDRKPFRRCASPFKAKVRPGRHLFEVRAVSAAGIPDPTPAVFRWRVLAARAR